MTRTTRCLPVTCPPASGSSWHGPSPPPPPLAAVYHHSLFVFHSLVLRKFTKPNSPLQQFYTARTRGGEIEKKAHTHSYKPSSAMRNIHWLTHAYTRRHVATVLETHCVVPCTYVCMYMHVIYALCVYICVHFSESSSHARFTVYIHSWSRWWWRTTSHSLVLQSPTFDCFSLSTLLALGTLVYYTRSTEAPGTFFLVVLAHCWSMGGTAIKK